MTKYILTLTLSQTTNFRLFKPKEFADDNFRFDESGRKFSKWEENNVEKGDIAGYEQFFLLPQCFKRPALQTRKNLGLLEKVNGTY